MDTLFQPFKNHSANKAGLDIRLFFSGIVTACARFNTSAMVRKWKYFRFGFGFPSIMAASWQHNETAKGKIQYDVAMGISGQLASVVSYSYFVVLYF
ncbi:hypothetical protein CHS0354_041066 [Potamilus streckersoni]|uniref:Uncharacterized protein n=1 Tax=Potamilus streckersoni TaxID=2493646 RepID=A0AAE0VV10_9BIVA|nr:hypothetical protein CHS0354_041066 [Potamilus streckersoni]